MQFFNFSSFVEYLGNSFLIQGALITLALTVTSALGGMALGMCLAAMKMAKSKPLSLFASFYLWIFRGTPLLVQLVVVFTGLPQLGIKLGVVESTLLALIMNEAAYMAEIIRSGFMGVPSGQREAAESLGLPLWLVVSKITLPQAFRLMIPPLGNSVNSLLKSTSLASVISMEELMRRSQVLMQQEYQVLEVFGAAAVFYLIMTTAWGFVQRALEKHFGASHALERQDG
ncbi:amino acid ABC transporter permease [Castellaniella sp. S9]|uniref:amino acid ABC transporter permease n=1 Tax=Castellaniella sp. S9 TaxID=2993652 RepID=UPI0022B2D258|nr:amino acid ABC transporter permease [Castellaniella sp. S9]